MIGLTAADGGDGDDDSGGTSAPVTSYANGCVVGLWCSNYSIDLSCDQYLEYP